MSAVLYILVGLPLLIYWVLIGKFLLRRSGDVTVQILQSILFAALTVNAILTFVTRQQLDELRDLALVFILFPFAIFYAFGPWSLSSELNYSFLISISTVGLLASCVTLFIVRKNTGNIYVMSIVMILSFYVACLGAGNILASYYIEKSAKLQQMDCFKKNRSFAGSVFNTHGHTHAEAQKNGEHYLWSYAELQFFKPKFTPSWKPSCTTKDRPAVR